MSRRADRRRFLQGLGATLALPWLETPRLWAGERSTPMGQPPRRFACLFMANGVNPQDWGASGEGDSLALKRSLAPLEPWKRQLLILNGLYHPNAAHGNIHIAAAPNMLSGARVQQSTSDLLVATSLDQVIAQERGGATEFPSLVLGIEPPYLGTHKGYSCIYCSHISWSNANTPVPRENDPRSLYDRLVGDPHGKRTVQSVLDLVLEDARGLMPRLSSWDRRRLNDYLASVREVEQRLDRVVPGGAAIGEQIKQAIPQPEPTAPTELTDHMRLMLDLLAIALATDSTRVATLMFNNDLSKMDFGFLRPGSTSLTNMHTMSHAGGEDYSRMNRFHVEMLAHFLARLSSCSEGEGSVLDHACVMFCSSLMSGGAHDRSQVPLVLAGGLGGKLQTGRALDYRQQPEGQRRLSNLYLRLLNELGIEQRRFSDSVEPLPL